MKKLFAAIAFMGVCSLAACGGGSGTDGGDSGGDGCGGGCSGGSSKMDGSQSTIDMYVNGTMKASYWVQVHAEPAAGQYWEMSYEMSGMKNVTRWQVTKIDGSTAIIENQMKMDSEYMVSDYTIAYEVNLGAAEGEANVTKAWIGKTGEAPKEIQVMEKPAPACGGCTGATADVKEEAFTDLEMAGMKFSGKIWITNAGGTESKTWMADNGWFNKIIKMESGSFSQSLTAAGTDAAPLLKW